MFTIGKKRVSYVGILEDAPGFKPCIYRLVSRSNTRLHPLIGDRVAWVIRALDLVDGVHVAVVGLDALARVEEAPEDLIKILMSVHFPAGYGPWIHTRSPPKMLTPISYWSADFPAYLCDANAFPRIKAPICRIRKSVPSMDIRQ